MEIQSTSTGDAARVAPRDGRPDPAPLGPLAEALWGDARERPPLPPLADLLSASISLATGRRRKALLPMAEEPAELALVRRGDDVLVSCYATGAAPEVWLLDRRVPLRRLLESCGRAARAAAASLSSDTEREVTVRLAERVETVQIADDLEPPRAVQRRGGALEDPGDDAPLAFGFEASIAPCPMGGSEASARADLHALLFEGSLWVWARGHRIQLARGPIMLAAQRMVAAVRALVEASEADRGANVRLRSGGFHVGVRLDRGAVAVTLGTDGGSTVTVPALGLADAALPVLRLASDLVRALVAADRTQSRNLRVRAFREEVRRLRRDIRERERNDGFVNRDPDRLRASTPPEVTEPPRTAASPQPGRLRFSERWSAEVAELDATSTFFCGDRLVVASPRRAVALSRDDGGVLWVREGTGGSAWMVGRTLLRLSPDGAVELCDVRDGEPYATARVAPRVGPAVVLGAGGRTLPPIAVIAEAESRLCALDLRTGEPLWRFTARAGSALRLRRVGRVLLVVSGDAVLSALDVASGEIVWRFTDKSRFCFAPAVCRDVVVAAGGESSARSGTLYGIDLYTGEPRWRRRMHGAPAAAPFAAGTTAAIAIGGARNGSLATFEPATGELRWMAPDPGLGAGGACMAVDRALVVNAPAGRVTALDLDTGEARWARRLSDPVADDVPRRLEPVLRGGALFVPAASVHVLRPSDGASLGAALPCDLVPDLMRVDERGWVYVAEESGQLSAYAPVPQLSLVR